MMRLFRFLLGWFRSRFSKSGWNEAEWTGPMWDGVVWDKSNLRSGCTFFAVLDEPDDSVEPVDAWAISNPDGKMLVRRSGKWVQVD